MILQQIENNEDNENQLVDSLEEVIKDLSDLYHDISFNESIDYDHEYVSSDYLEQYDLTTIINDDRETVTTNAQDEVTPQSETAIPNDALTDNAAVTDNTLTDTTAVTNTLTDTTGLTDTTLTDTSAVTDSTLTETTALTDTLTDTTAVTDSTLTDSTAVTDATAVTELAISVERETLFLLQRSNNLTETDMSVLSALLELEKLRGAQQDMEDQIQDKVNQLELLLENNGTEGTEGTDIPPHSEDSRPQKFIDQKPRDGKTLDISGKKKPIETSVNLFANLQAQLFGVLDARHKILQDVSEKLNRELAVFQQTVDFLQRLVNFKLDQGRDTNTAISANQPSASQYNNKTVKNAIKFNMSRQPLTLTLLESGVLFR